MGARLGILFAFLLSVAAAGGAYYLYQGGMEERMRRESVEAKYEQVKEKILVVQSEKEQVNAEKEKYKAESEEYRARAQAMQGQLEKLQSEQIKNQEAQENLQKQLTSNLATVNELKKKVEDLDRKAKEAQQACVAKPEDMLPQPQPFSPSPTPVGVTVAASGVTAAGLAFTSPTPAPISTPSSLSVSSGAVPITAPEPSKAPSLTTVFEEAKKGPRVLTVNRKFNFVVVNQGLQDGLKIGDKLEIVMQGRGTAKVQVEKIYDKFSAATILEESPQNQIVEGDEVRRI